MAEQIKLMNMCMVVDQDGRVLVQNRQKKDWSGLTFPGGKVEPGESLTAAVIREVWEETGLTIADPRLCGVTEWYDEEKRRNIVLLYRAEKYSGVLTDSKEGHMEWMHPDALKGKDAAFGMNNYLHLFYEEDKTEMWYQNSPKSWESVIF